MINIVNKLFGSIKSNSLKKYASFVEKVNKLEEGISKLSDKELKNKTNYFKNEYNKTDNHYCIGHFLSSYVFKIRKFIPTCQAKNNYKKHHA